MVASSQHAPTTRKIVKIARKIKPPGLRKPWRKTRKAATKKDGKQTINSRTEMPSWQVTEPMMKYYLCSFFAILRRHWDSIPFICINGSLPAFIFHVEPLPKQVYRKHTFSHCFLFWVQRLGRPSCTQPYTALTIFLSGRIINLDRHNGTYYRTAELTFSRAKRIRQP